jgi:hypothetical protein
VRGRGGRGEWHGAAGRGGARGRGRRAAVQQGLGGLVRLAVGRGAGVGVGGQEERGAAGAAAGGGPPNSTPARRTPPTSPSPTSSQPIPPTPGAPSTTSRRWCAPSWRATARPSSVYTRWRTSRVRRWRDLGDLAQGGTGRAGEGRGLLLGSPGGPSSACTRWTTSRVSVQRELRGCEGRGGCRSGAENQAPLQSRRPGRGRGGRCTRFQARRRSLVCPGKP